MVGEPRYVTSEYLNALVPSFWEVIAKILGFACILPAVSQATILIVGVSKSPRFSIGAVVIFSICSTVGIAVSYGYQRRRMQILKRGY